MIKSSVRGTIRGADQDVVYRHLPTRTVSREGSPRRLFQARVGALFLDQIGRGQSLILGALHLRRDLPGCRTLLEGVLRTSSGAAEGRPRTGLLSAPSSKRR